MAYSHNMKNETAPRRKVLLPEGWREFKVLNVKYQNSKSGNPMFVFTVRDIQTQYEENLYAVDVEGKRGFLKMFLSGCGVEENESGVFEWEESDVIGQTFRGLVEHEPNEWIDREGKAHSDKQHRIVEITSLEWKE